MNHTLPSAAQYAKLVPNSRNAAMSAVQRCESPISRATRHAAPIASPASTMESAVSFASNPQIATNGSSSTAGSGAS